MSLNDTFTSTGAKFFAHEEAMRSLRAGKGRVITCHVMAHDACNHSCAFCSVAARAGDSLPFDTITGFIDLLIPFGLKSCILSGGGNPILYKCKQTGKNFNDVVDAIHLRGLEIGLITNGMPLKRFEMFQKTVTECEDLEGTFRESWSTVRPETLDKLTWIRISMAGLDHAENEVYVPDIDLGRTTLGFSYVGHDIFFEPADPHHGKVSTRADILSGERQRTPDRSFEDRLDELTESIGDYVRAYKPRYVRLLPNCLEPAMIPDRCAKLEAMAAKINESVAGLGIGAPAFVQQKPPKAPHACYLGYVHPVLNCDGYVYPCDSCVLNEAANHSFANPWRVCRWDEVASIYEQPVRSLIADPAKTCPGCVFSGSNALLETVVNGTADLTPPAQTPEHVNFV